MTFLAEAQAIGNTAARAYSDLLLASLSSAEIHWHPVTLATEAGELRFEAMADALKIEGVRVNATAEAEIAIAERLDAVLLTPILSDAVWLEAARSGRQIAPQPRPITSSVAGMLAHSADVDAAAAGARFVADPGKDWCYASGRIVTYGWHASTAWARSSGIPIGPARTAGLWVVQGAFAGHGLHHSDYSQVVRLVRRACVWRGEPADLGELYAEGLFGAGLGAPTAATPAADNVSGAAVGLFALGFAGLAWLFSRRSRA